jgi:hypothetical protein
VSFAPAASFAPATATTNAGGEASTTWTLVEGSNTGTASAPGDLSFATPVSFSVTAVQLTPVAITTASPLPGATMGSAYSQTLQASGGDGTYAWSVVGGALPAGLSLSAAGVLSGTPTAIETASFTVQATSAGGTLTATKVFSLSVGYPGAFGSIAFEPAPSNSQCYALNAVMVPHIGVKVTSTTGAPLAGVQVNIVAVTNNGSKVVVSQPSAVTGANGVAVFNTLSINKTGAYRLIAGTVAPWPVTTMQSGKFNISPSC